MKLRDARVLVTGGSSGIGLEVARQLAAEGAQVWIAARDPARLEAARAELGVRAVVMDVTDDASVAAAVRELGEIDVLVNNAGAAVPGNFVDQDEAVCRRMIELNYLGAVRVTKALLPQLIARRSGVIVNVTSILGFMGFTGYAAYAASKYALVGFSECLRQDLLPHGVRVLIAYPPTTETPGLVEENRTKPPECQAIEGTGDSFPPAAVARAIVRGIRKEQYTILVGAKSGAIWRLTRHTPGLARWILDRTLRRHLRQQLTAPSR